MIYDSQTVLLLLIHRQLIPSQLLTIRYQTVIRIYPLIPRNHDVIQTLHHQLFTESKRIKG